MATVVISVLFLKSIYNLKRTQQGIDFDQVILIIELVKVSVLMTKSLWRLFDISCLSVDPALRNFRLFCARLLRPGLLQPDLIHDSHNHLLSLSPQVSDFIGTSANRQSHFLCLHHTSSLLWPLRGCRHLHSSGPDFLHITERSLANLHSDKRGHLIVALAHHYSGCYVQKQRLVEK